MPLSVCCPGGWRQCLPNPWEWGIMISIFVAKDGKWLIALCHELCPGKVAPTMTPPELYNSKHTSTTGWLSFTECWGNYCHYGRHVVSNIEVDIEITRWSSWVQETQRVSNTYIVPIPLTNTRISWAVQMYRKIEASELLLLDDDDGWSDGPQQTVVNASQQQWK